MTDRALGLRLYGTDEPAPAPRVLRAGRLTAELEGGNLRAIRFDGHELIRGVAFLVRSDAWATLLPEIADESVSQTATGFVVGYRARVAANGSVLEYDARIDGEADGTLRFAVTARAREAFRTNRAGFVVLHAADLAGREADIEHTDGRRERRRFPELIDPVQPMLDLRAIGHEAAPGLRVVCRMEGDTFEMEDQRNWTDASFKTYCRPLALPYPYTLAAGDGVEQAVSLTVTADLAAPALHRDSDIARLVVDAERTVGEMPRIGLGCTPDEAVSGLPWAHLLRPLGLGALVCRFDAGSGHGPAALRDFAALASALGAEAELQVVVQSADDVAAELAQLAAMAAASGLRPGCVLLVPAADMRPTPLGQTASPSPPLPELYRAARAAFPHARIGGGTFCGFTELNRKRPPLDDLDVVTFATCAIIHAADDRSVMETLQALPAVAASACAIAGHRRFVVGPSAIGLRDNPVGAAPLANPRGLRQPMSGFDPRQRGQFNAAWSLGLIAGFAYGGAQRVALSAPAGDFGVLHDGAALPVAQVLADCASLHGRPLLRVAAPPGIVALAVTAEGGPLVLLANTTPDRVTLDLALSTGGGVAATLEPYATARLRLAPP